MAEFEVRKHGANHWAIWEDGHITDMRVADRRAGELVVQRIQRGIGGAGVETVAGEFNDAVALDRPDLMAALWADMAEEEGEGWRVEAPLELHGHYCWGGEEPVILLHAHEDSQAEHSHDLFVDLDEDGVPPATDHVLFAEKLVGARDALRDAAAHLAEGPTSQLRKSDREAIAAAWEYLKAGEPVGPQTAPSTE